MPPLSAFFITMSSYDLRVLSACDSSGDKLGSESIFAGAMSSICLQILLSSLFLQMTGLVFLSLTSASLVKFELKYFSRILSFLVNTANSAFASR